MTRLNCNTASALVILRSYPNYQYISMKLINFYRQLHNISFKKWLIEFELQCLIAPLTLRLISFCKMNYEFNVSFFSLSFHIFVLYTYCGIILLPYRCAIGCEASSDKKKILYAVSCIPTLLLQS